MEKARNIKARERVKCNKEIYLDSYKMSLTGCAVFFVLFVQVK